MTTSENGLDTHSDVELRRSRLVRMITYFPDLHSAAEALGLRSTLLARATSDSQVDLRALREVEAVVDRMEADFERVEGTAPTGRPLRITLPDGKCVTGIVRRLVPREGTPWAEIDVLGPNLFDAEHSGLYVADVLRFDPLGAPPASDTDS